MENELSRVVDVLPGLVWTARPDGHVDFVNQGWCDYTGLGRDQVSGNGWQAAIHPVDLPDLLERWRAILASGEPREMQARLRRFDGVYRRFVIRTRALTDASGQVTKWCCVNSDIEDCQRVQESARGFETDFRVIADSIPAPVALMTPSGEVESVNRHVLEYLGATLEELKGWANADTVHPDDLPSVVAAWMRSVDTGEPYDIEHRIRRADGAYHWFHVRGLPLRDSEGRITQWCVLQADIEDQKRDQALLAGEKRLLEMVVSGCSMPEVLESLCMLVESTVAGCHCSVALTDPSGTRLEQCIGPSLPAGFVNALVGRPVDLNSGPCAMATCLNKQVIASDVQSDARLTSEWRRMALAHGIEACWSTPISATSGAALGAFAIYYDKPRAPTPQQQALIGQFTHIVSIAVEREQAQTSLTRALDKLKASEGQLRTIIDAIPGFVWSAAPDGSVEFLNQRWCEFTGASLEDACGTGWQSSIHPDDSEGLRGYWKSLLETGESGEFEARLRRFDGTFRWFLIQAVPLRDSGGRLLKWYGQNTDIEDRKQAEMLLSGEKRLLGMMARGSSLPPILEALCELVESAVSGCRCSITLVNPKPLHLSRGAAPSLPDSLMKELDGQPANVDASPDAMAAALNRQVMSTDLLRETRWQAWRSKALLHGLRSIQSTPISSKAGKVMGVLSILDDRAAAPAPDQNLIAQFTHLAGIAIERARGEAALKQSEAFLAKAQRLSTTGTFSWRMATGEVIWSEEIYRIYDLDPAVPATFELIDTRLHPDDMPSHHEMRRQQRGDGTDFEHEHRLLMPDGEVKYLHLVAHATWDDDGQLEYIGAVQDVTERRLSEEALGRVRSELTHVARLATLGALTASIAHEVNQPLAGIITNANTCLRMLAASPPNVDGARETARRTIRDGNRASDVIKRLRALFSKKGVMSENLNLNEAAREVIAMLLDELQRNGVILHPEFADDLPPVMGDRVQLQQVILNLLLNASDAMNDIVGRPRRMVIRTELDAEDHVRLTVKDSGTGFDPTDADRLFTAFYTTKGEGMGIGLSISRSIVESHRGRLWAAPNDGVGSTFAFSIPCVPHSVTNTRSSGIPCPYVTTDQDHTVESF